MVVLVSYLIIKTFLSLNKPAILKHLHLQRAQGILRLDQLQIEREMYLLYRAV